MQKGSDPLNLPPASHSCPHTPAHSGLSTAVSWGCLQAFASAVLGTSLVVQWALPMQGAWVQSLVGELRSCMPHGVAKKKKKLMLFYTLEHLSSSFHLRSKPCPPFLAQPGSWHLWEVVPGCPVTLFPSSFLSNCPIPPSAPGPSPQTWWRWQRL